MQQGRIIASGKLSVAVSEGQVRGLSFDGVEILRGLSAPVRDRNWGTIAVVIDAEDAQDSSYSCQFSEPSGLFCGDLRIDLDTERRFTADFSISFAADAEINRAGFCLLHPIKHVAGELMTVLHSDGSKEQSHFPQTISPTQPARDIVGLTHEVGPVAIQIGMEGDVFEMEDQRNWSDASFKTYCRPLSRPHPFAVTAGQVIRQRVTIDVVQVSEARPEEAVGLVEDIVLPQVLLAFEPGLASLDGLVQFADTPILARITRDTAQDILQQLAARSEVALEIVFDALSELGVVAEQCRAARLHPVRVVGMPSAFLRSYQPEGPWPPGPTPDDAVAVLRRVFAGVPVGGGSLTNFTEFNRGPPKVDVDFLTFGNTAIVHAADDLSVTQTLEALPDIFASAQQARPGRPLHLGLFSIAMRSNPYGADVSANPSGKAITMTRRDGRQETAFAGAYGIAVLAEAARAGVESLALAMPDGDLGAAGRPLAEVIHFATRHAGASAQLKREQGLYTMRIGDLELAANVSATPRHPEAGVALTPFSFQIEECRT